MDSVDIDQTLECGVMDYRRSPIIIEQSPSQFTVTLRFDFLITSDDVNVRDRKKLASEWCKENTPESVIADLEQVLPIVSAKWTGSNVLEMVLPPTYKVTSVSNDTVSVNRPLSKEYIRIKLQTNPLEDTSFNGNPGKTFWVVPCSFGRKF